MVLDYGNHLSDTPTLEEQQHWSVRADPFSSFRSGFDVRTLRLCQRILVFHDFPELGGPCLVRSTDFDYDHDSRATRLIAATQVGYLGGVRYALPPLKLGYSSASLHDTVAHLPETSLDGLTVDARWVDLDGEGIAGALMPSDSSAWRYMANLGGGKLAPPVLLPSLPVPSALSSGLQQLVDLDGDGRLELAQYASPMSGWFTRNNGGWENFRPFSSMPRIDWNNPDIRFADLNGDGLAELIVANGDRIEWHPNLGLEGFGEPRTLNYPVADYERPVIGFNQAAQAVHFADMTGDGLADLVQIVNGRVAYWPNLGHGRFGRKVLMGNSPLFAPPDIFDPSRLRLVDLDGTGATDIVYLGGAGAQVYFNRSGNALSDVQLVTTLPLMHSMASVQFVDILGNGTACAVWTSENAPSLSQKFAYIDLFGGVKPNLLISIENGYGAETALTYGSSALHYLADKLEGHPWATRLPFPVQVIDRVERRDRLAETLLVTRYRYHHGHWDGIEREFGGFAHVQQWDADILGDGANELALPPVRTETWFHTGAWLERDKLEKELEKEYYPGDALAPLLHDTILPPNLSLQEEREAARALKGQILRQEVYADDGSPKALHPYTVSERDYEVRLVQPVGKNPHAVYFVHPRNALNLHYERDPSDPRIQHERTLEVDDYGNVLYSAAVAYARRKPEKPEQGRQWIALTENTYRNEPRRDWYRLGVPLSTTVYEVEPIWGDEPLLDADIRNGPTRLVSRERITYTADDGYTELPPGDIDSHALPGQKYRLAMDVDARKQTCDSRITDAMLAEAGYSQDSEGAWAPSGRVEFDPGRFYLPTRAIDPFGNATELSYYPYNLKPTESLDPLGNSIRLEYDLRTLAPNLLTDPNGNQFATKYDAFGRVVAEAVMGQFGIDKLDSLASPTLQHDYNDHAWLKDGQPPCVWTQARERHGDPDSPFQISVLYADGSGRELAKKMQADPGPISKGGMPPYNALERWVGTGRTIYDNKGNPVKKYEPYFSEGSQYEPESEFMEQGVTPVLRYDPVERMVRTDFPDGTHTRVEFDAWTQTTWDQSDTVDKTPWLSRRQFGNASEKRAGELSLKHAETPTRALLDALGRPFLTIEDTGQPDKRATRVELDLQGNALKVWDAREVLVLKQVFDLLGQTVKAESADAGTTHALFDVAGKPLWGWTARGHGFRHEYDQLRRPVRLTVESDGWLKTRNLTEYGESHPKASECNLRGRIYRSFDGAGLSEVGRYDYAGRPLEIFRRLPLDFVHAPDWRDGSSAESMLESEEFFTQTEYDALGRIVSKETPDKSVTTNRYNRTGQLDAVEVRRKGENSGTLYVTQIDYNARGQRTRIEYGKGTQTEYTYDLETFRLLRLLTQRGGGADLQDLEYFYDASGNIVEIVDKVSYGNQAVSGGGRYEYDALYQLVYAEGREHPTQLGDQEEVKWLPHVHPHDYSALMRYEEWYEYDLSGNILTMAHSPEIGAQRHRSYTYDQSSNRLVRTYAGNSPWEVPTDFEHDAAGNMTKLSHLDAMEWDESNQLRYTVRGEGEVYFAYDSSGERVRKVYRHGAYDEERIYLSGWEVYRKRYAGTDKVEFQRETLHVMDDRRRIALIETDEKTGSRVRYQAENHLGSSCMELDDNGDVIGYEEYLPYGGTAFQVQMAGVSRRRYRYTGKEKDEETGLYYHGARYYAAWLGRWTSADPAGFVDGPNLYQYVISNPVTRLDPHGTLSYDQGTQAFTVEDGDTLSSISEDTGFSQEEIRRANVDGNGAFEVKAGMNILLPKLNHAELDGIEGLSDVERAERYAALYDRLYKEWLARRPSKFRLPGIISNRIVALGQLTGDLVGDSGAPICKEYAKAAALYMNARVQSAEAGAFAEWDWRSPTAKMGEFANSAEITIATAHVRVRVLMQAEGEVKVLSVYDPWRLDEESVARTEAGMGAVRRFIRRWTGQ